MVLKFSAHRSANYTIEGTVATGLEEIAKEECEEKLRVENIMTRQGGIIWHLKLDQILDILQLRCVQHLGVIIGHCKLQNENWSHQITNLVNHLDWARGLEAWKTTTGSSAFADDISFRVTCNRSGQFHPFNSQTAAGVLGAAVVEKFGWTVNLSKFNLEIILNIRDEEVSVALALIEGSLHRRNITHFGRTTLKATISHSLLRLLNIQPNDVICDPMCGTGSIPIEGAVCWPLAYHLCGEIKTNDVLRAQQNVTAINIMNYEKRNSFPNCLSNNSIQVEICKWDARSMPVRDELIDGLVTDLPYGIRVGSRFANRTLYPKVLNEFARVVKRETGRAVLMTADKKNFQEALEKNGDYWKPEKHLHANIGGIYANVYLLLRTANRFRPLLRHL